MVVVSEERRRERGSVAPLVALLAVMAGGLCLVLGQLGGTVQLRAAAQTAADAAALAAAAEGEDAGRALAAANGAEVLELELDEPEAQVRVRRRGVMSVARARDDVRAAAWETLGGGAGSVRGLVPELRAALAEAERLLGVPVPITSGWRSRAEQQRLHDDRGSNPYPVARPGTSMHERGRAIDVLRSFAPRLAAIAAQVGLCRPWPDTDAIHFELCRRTE